MEKGETMSQTELAELRQWLQQLTNNNALAAANLHEKIDRHAEANTAAHLKLHELIAAQDKITAVNAVKIGALVTLLAIGVSSLTQAWFLM